MIIAEAALLGCQILLSADPLFSDAEKHPSFRKVLTDSDADGDELVIATPRHMGRTFFRSKQVSTTETAVS